jgi:hypothetical protein
MTSRTFLIGGALLVGLLAVVKPAIVRTDNHARLLVLLRWQSGTVRFVNSVTERPVAIHFRVGGTFRDFSVATDAGTEAYYTGGMYSMNEVVSVESLPSLRFCSIKGISVTIGFYDIQLNDGCLEVKLLWTI